MNKFKTPTSLRSALTRRAVLLISLLVASAACGGSEPQATQESQTEAIVDALQDLTETAPVAGADNTSSGPARGFAVIDGTSYFFTPSCDVGETGDEVHATSAIDVDGEPGSLELWWSPSNEDVNRVRLTVGTDNVFEDAEFFIQYDVTAADFNGNTMLALVSGSESFDASWSISCS